MRDGLASMLRGAGRWSLDRGTVLRLALLAVGIVAGLFAWGYQLREGLAVTNMRNHSVWGLYVVLYMYFVGLSGGALILASTATLTRSERLRPLVLPALLQATTAIVVAALFLLVDIGRPERVLNILAHPNFSSPMVWDLVIVIIGVLICGLLLWTRARANAGPGYGRFSRTLACAGLVVAVLVVSIDAWIFGLQNSRPFWHSAIMAPLFICSGLVSAIALLIVVDFLAGSRRRAETISEDLIGLLAKLLGVLIGVNAFLVFNELLTAAYPGAGREVEPVARLLTGRLSPLFWAEIALGMVVPASLLATARFRAKKPCVVVAATLALLGLFAHRFIIVANGLSEATVGSAPGVPIGVPQASGTSTFVLTALYRPSWVEWLVALGLVCLGALLFASLSAIVRAQRR